MSTRRIRVAVLTLTLVAAAIGVLSLGTTPIQAEDQCLAGICGPKDPPVVCSDRNVYPNICVANANCQYDCVVIGFIW